MQQCSYPHSGDATLPKSDLQHLNRIRPPGAGAEDPSFALQQQQQYLAQHRRCSRSPLSRLFFSHSCCVSTCIFLLITRLSRSSTLLSFPVLFLSSYIYFSFFPQQSILPSPFSNLSPVLFRLSLPHLLPLHLIIAIQYLYLSVHCFFLWEFVFISCLFFLHFWVVVCVCSSSSFSSIFKPPPTTQATRRLSITQRKQRYRIEDKSACHHCHRRTTKKPARVPEYHEG